MAVPRIINVSRSTSKSFMRHLHIMSPCEDADLRIRSNGQVLRRGHKYTASINVREYLG